MERRYALIGAHRQAGDLPGVVWFDVPPVALSAVEFDASLGTAHSEVISRALEARRGLIELDTFIAIRYGISVGGRADALARCAIHAERWHAILEKNAGTVEVTLRVGGGEKTPRPDRHEFKSGADYLRALHHSLAPKIDEATRREIDSTILPLSVAHRWSGRADGGSELVALIRRENLDAVRQAGLDLQSRLEGLPFLLSGPWPLEAFGDEEQE